MGFFKDHGQIIKEKSNMITDPTKIPQEMTKEIKWSKLDNTAHLFPVIAGTGVSNVYRVACVLSEDVDGVLLQKALDMVLPQFPVFNSRLRQGMFWYYFEENSKKAPTVEEENTYPCRFIQDNKNRSYLFRVTYYKKRINLEVFHVLTDGMGGFGFLKELVYQYLRLKYPEVAAQYPDKLDSKTSLNMEDSFLKNSKSSTIHRSYKKEKAYIIKGHQFKTEKMGIVHGYMPSDQLKKVSKEFNCSINEFLVASYIWAIYQEYLKGTASKKPITIACPVNCRPYFNSITTRNFFVMVTAAFHPTRANQPFEDVLEEVKSSLREQITKEHIEEILAYNTTGETVLILKSVPLVFKKIVMKTVYRLAASANTSTVTNLGVISVEEGYKPYIKSFIPMISRSVGQNIKMTIGSYDGTTVTTITSVLKDTNLQRSFYRFLTSHGIDVSIETNGVFYE